MKSGGGKNGYRNAWLRQRVECAPREVPDAAGFADADGYVDNVGIDGIEAVGGAARWLGSESSDIDL